MSLPKLGDEQLRYFRSIRHALEKVIEKHLPGDFSTWEKDHSTWEGAVKTVDATQPNPGTITCAWKIYAYYCFGEEVLGFANKKTDLKALDELEVNIRELTKSLNSLSVDAFLQLGKDSGKIFESFSNIHPVALWKPFSNALEQAIPNCRAFVQETGTAPSGENRVAAAVTKACQEVFEVRSGHKAPKVVRDDTHYGLGPVPFSAFTEDIFKVLGIKMRVASALDILKSIRN